VGERRWTAEASTGWRRLAWWSRPPGIAILMLIVVQVVGTTGYMAIEGWSAWDAVYMTVITVTTVGYREVAPLSFEGQVFTVVLLVGGVGTVFYCVTLLAARLIDSGFHRRWEDRRQARMIDALRQHYIVCGFGRIGRTVVEEFRRQGVPHIVIDRDPERVHEVLESGGLAVAADASNEEVLKRVGIDHARGLIAAVSTDAENVYTILSARLLRPDLFIIGRAESEDARRKLQRAGADRVLSPYQIGALQMAQTALRPAVVDFVQLATSSEHLELSMEQVRIADASPLDGQTLVTANLRQRFGIVVVAIQRAAGHMEFNPSPDATMRTGDHLVVLGPPDRVKALELVAEAALA
jgi:voltage-gated potassium channel